MKDLGINSLDIVEVVSCSMRELKVLEFQHKGMSLFPFSVVQALLEHQMTSEQWLELCSKTGISDLKLDPSQ